MKSTEYYCGHHFAPRDAQELTTPQYLIRKIEAAKCNIDDLLFVSFKHRDMHRINKTIKAIKHWQEQLNEVYGIEKEIE